MDILEIHGEELPGFPAMNGLSRAIRGAAAKTGGLLHAVSAETSQGLGKGF
jgi:folate-dependent phosphoribosylglycinamide formyltransferase PurN